MNDIINKIVFVCFLCISTSFANADEKQLNFYIGNFDFSDDGKKSTLFGLEHQNLSLVRDSIIGEISPVTGAFITADSAKYIYTGIQANYKIGSLNFNPSFTPGFYDEGDGKDLGHVIEFKSEIQISANISETTKIGFSYNHLSNASLGSKNPGANSYLFNFIKKF
tara:strand:+ start:522 stop:1019 length:498 start_codon:yes stop_codon:yes gene_type:complete